MDEKNSASAAVPVSISSTPTSISAKSDTPVSFESFAPKSLTQRSRLSRIEALVSPLPSDETAPSNLLTALTPTRSSAYGEQSQATDDLDTSHSVSCAQRYTQRLNDQLSQTNELVATLKIILSQHIPDLISKHDSLVHRSAEAITTAQKLELDATALFRHAHEIATPLQRFDAVDAWATLIGLHFQGSSSNHSHSASDAKNTYKQQQLATIQKRTTSRLKLDPIDDLVRALDQLDEAIAYFDNFIINNPTASSSHEYNKRANIVRDEILDLVRDTIVDRITQTTTDVKTNLGLITTYSQQRKSSAVPASSNAHRPTSSSSSHMNSSTSSSHPAFSFIHAVGGVVPGDILEASLIYTRFHGISYRIYGLLRIIYQHMTASSNISTPSTKTGSNPTSTYKLVWDTCRTTYFSSRELLLRCSIRAHLELLQAKHGLVGMTRLASVFIARLCTTETALYLDFFGDRSFSSPTIDDDTQDKVSPAPAQLLQQDATSVPPFPSHKTHAPTLSLELSSYLQTPSSPNQYPNVICDSWFQSFMDTLCSHFHTTIRRGVVSMLDIDTLCQIVMILREEKNSIPSHSYTVLAPASKVMMMILEDVQERLIFCATSIVQREVVKFKPSLSDLDYPAKLLNLRSEEEDTRNTPPSQTYESWFPPLKSSLRVLSKIFGVVENKVFEDLALTCVRACTKSLKEASIHLRQKNGSGGILHSDLFLIQHLLILREQLSPFDIQLQTVERQLDFSDAGKAMSKLWSNAKTSRKMFFAMSTENTLLTLLKEGVSVKESPLDSKRDLEDSLRSSCTDFIEHTSVVLIGPILELLNEYKSWSLTHNADKVDPPSSDMNKTPVEVVPPTIVSWPPHLSSSVVMEALSRSMDRLEPQHGEVLRQMSLYMDATTQIVLWKPVVRKVHRSLEDVRRLFLGQVYCGWTEKSTTEAMVMLDQMEIAVKKPSMSM